MCSDQYKIAKEHMKLTTNDLKRMTPYVRRMINDKTLLKIVQDYRVIAEAVHVEHCGAGIEVGDNYVFDLFGTVKPEESTAPNICTFALAPMVGFFYMSTDHATTGHDPVSIAALPFECLDTGIGHGGVGKVKFILHVKKAKDRKSVRKREPL